MTEGFRSLTEEQEIVRAVDDAIEKLNRAVGRATKRGYFVSFETCTIGDPFPYRVYSAIVYKRLVDKPDETKL